MGQEIASDHFHPTDWRDFSHRLQQETDLLNKKFMAGECSQKAPVGGFEIEGWLIDEKYRPFPQNTAFFDAFHNDLASAELAKFNIELNNSPKALQGPVFHAFEQDLVKNWDAACVAAKNIQARIMLLGILPTARPEDFCIENMSDLNRYHALNEQVLIARDHQPIHLDIRGEDHLLMDHHSVMLEAATTSFQVHMQVPYDSAHHYFNASIMASAATLAVSANSPFLFNQSLWHETRIPLFEQSVNTGNDQLLRVTFGHGFAEKNILKCFENNRLIYPVLLPMIFDKPADRFTHLRLHNGVIWRWNRPLLGFDEDGTLHFRIEHRVMPAGPTLQDMVANAVFYYGLAQALKTTLQKGEKPVSFEQAKTNFYRASKSSLSASVTWENQTYHISELIQEKLIPLAEKGLSALNITSEEISNYLGIISDRVTKGQNGAVWQLKSAKKNRHDMLSLTQAYFENQRSAKPVHQWEV